MRPLKLHILVAGMLALQAPEILAQTSANAATTSPPTSSRSSNRLLEEVVVTAQKREENSQDIPITITAFSQEKLDAFGIENTADLARITPGLTFTYTYGYTVIYLRGVGTDAFLPSADPSVATYIDGISIPSGQGKQDSLGPVERVEVLKGPQGTLFGRNATGGAISMVTPKPPEEFVGTLKADYGKYDADALPDSTEKKSWSLYLAGPITESIGVSFGMYRELPMLLADNKLENGETGPLRKDFSKGARLKVSWDMTDTLNATLIHSRVEQFNGPAFNYENTRPSPTLAGAFEPGPEDRVYNNDFQGGVETDTTLTGLILDWNAGPVDLKFIYSDQEADIPIASTDYDQTYNNQVTFFTYHQFNEQKTYELQILSNENTWLSDNLQWAAGLYRLEAAGGFERLFFTVGSGFATNVIPNSGIVTSIPGVGDILNDSSSNVTLEGAAVLVTESNSAYFQGTWTFNEAWNATFGIRYQEESRTIRDAYLDLVNTAPPPSDDYYKGDDRSRNTRVDSFSVDGVKESTVSPRVAIQYFPTDGIQIFSSLSRGFKSPTYNTINFFSDPDLVEKETATALEIGFKTDLFDNTLRLNGAFFKSEIENVVTAIVSLNSGGVVRFYNAGMAEIEGAEIDLQWQPMPNLNPGLAFTASGTWLDAVYTDFQNGSGFDDDSGLYFGSDNVSGADGRDFSGNPVVRTPDQSYSATLNQFISFGDYGEIEMAVDYFYSSGYNTTPQNSPFYEQGAYRLWNTRLSYFYNPLGLQITAYAQNLGNEEYYSTLLQNDFGRNVTLAEPRLIGLRLKWDFGELF